MIATQTSSRDQMTGKGAVEGDGRDPVSEGSELQASLSGQLGHRDQDPMLKANDTDFPEPDAKAEHTGE